LPAASSLNRGSTSSYTGAFPFPSHLTSANPSPRIPFYAWFRLFFLLYLIAPQTQGARLIYETRLHPFLRTHELAIDDFIATTHHRLRTSFWIYLRRAFNLAKSQLLGLPTQQEPLPPPPAQRSYTASLLERFNLPSARPAFAAAAGGGWSAADISGLLANAVSAATSSSPSVQTTNLVPESIQGPERASFISAQRERLMFLLSALDREATASPSEEAGRGVLGGMLGGDGEVPRRVSEAALSELSKSRSEGDFEKIDPLEGIGEAGAGGRKEPGTWMPWGWGGSPATEGEARSTGVDKGDKGL
jgi:receptor expression-enhancing protein 1/2/3/4